MATLKILLPLDQSGRDRIVLPHGVRIAKLIDATTLYVLHVVPMVKSLMPHTTKTAESYVDTIEANLRQQGIAAEALVRKGDPATEIVKIAAEYEVDMIFMGTRGRRGFDRLLLGSVAESVMASCRTPVTLVNEATAAGAVDERIRTQSAYIAGVIWNKVARGLYSEAQAESELQLMSAKGLDHDVLTSTYHAMKQSGVPAEWIDLDFQYETLRTFMPGEAPDRAVGDAA